MSLSRRTFLAAPVAFAAAAFLPSGLLASVMSETRAMPDLSSWDKVRAQFALDPAHAHFASFFIASHPAPVRDAIEGYRRAVDRDPFHVVERAMFEGPEHNLPLQVQTEIAEYLGARADDVCLTGNTTAGLALVYHGLPLQPGDEVLTTTHDHYSHHESIRLATDRAGASMRKIKLFDEASDSVLAVGNPKVKLHTPRSGDLSAGLVAFEIADLPPADVVKQLLAKRIIASTSPYTITYARLAPSLVNTPEQVDHAVRAVREISG